MVRTQSSRGLPIFKIGKMRLRRIRPGLVTDAPGDDRALGPFAAVDHAWIDTGGLVPMHEHQNDEILSYVTSGVMMHKDSAGYEMAITPHKLMMMNAGRSFYHEEGAPSAPVEMLQIFVRPESADLEPIVRFHERTTGFDNGEWNQIAGPSGSGAPLMIRNQVHIFDAHAAAGSVLTVPEIAGLTQWVYVMHGEVKNDGKRLGKGDAFSAPDSRLPAVQVVADAVLVAFLVDVTAPATLSGSQSGYRRPGVLAP